MPVNALNAMFAMAMSEREADKKEQEENFGNELTMTEKMLAGDGHTQ